MSINSEKYESLIYDFLWNIIYKNVNRWYSTNEVIINIPKDYFKVLFDKEENFKLPDYICFNASPKENSVVYNKIFQLIVLSPDEKDALREFISEHAMD